MKLALKLGVVLLAAGKSSRFGKNKLLVDFKNRPMVCFALDAMAQLPAERRIVVTADASVAALARARGFDVVMNQAQELGQSHSIHLGLAQMADMDAALLMVADQPLLTASSLCRMLEAFARSEKGIACLRDDTHMGNPAVFSGRYVSELLALSGDRGAKGVLRAHADDLLIIDCLHPQELSDADNPQALCALCETT